MIVPESVEQRILAQWLDVRGAVWCHVPNGGFRNIGTAHRLRLEGVKPGVPDVLIFTPPPRIPNARGCAIELKARGGRVSSAQEVWLELLQNLGWEINVCVGAEKAIAWLSGLGY